MAEIHNLQVHLLTINYICQCKAFSLQTEHKQGNIYTLSTYYHGYMKVTNNNSTFLTCLALAEPRN